MRKELFFTILVGLLVGLVVVFGIYRTKNFFSPKDQGTKLEASPSPQPSAETLGNLIIHTPEDESIQDKEEVTIAGSTNVDAFVVIFVGEEEFITTADESGNFSISTQLETGSNIITINSLDEDGIVVTEERTVIYTTQPLIEDESKTEEDSTKEDGAEKT
jgi:hypothetical protein